jgi:hypothetical protein
MPRCTGCGQEHDSHMHFGQGEPSPRNGDVALCFHCGHLMIYQDGALRDPTDDEIVVLAGDRRIVRAQEMIQLTKRHRTKQ